MASICVHRASRTPPDSTPRHIRSRDGLQEDHRPATHGRAGPAFPFPAIHLTRQSPFHGPAGHIARAMASICVHRAPRTPLDSTPGHIRSRDGIDLFPSSDPNPSRQHSRAHPLARWFAGRRIPSRNLRSRIRGVLQKSQALHLIKIRAGVCASHYALEGLRTIMFRIILY